MEKSLYKYILTHSYKQQILLLLLIFTSYPLIYIGFTIPKLIINDAISLGPGTRIVGWYRITQLEYLVVLCFGFLLVVLAGGGIKFTINVYRGMVGERLLRRLRYDLINRVMRFPLPAFNRISQGEVVSMVTQEVEKLGKFMGESISLPAFQGGILLTSLTFLIVENWMMGLASMALYPLQIYLIPKLQVKVNALEAKRVQMVRSLSARIGETMSGAQEIHSHAVTQYELAEYSARLGNTFALRYNLFKKKFFIKFFNNFLAQIGPFFFYLAGGYMVITGKLSLGGLVAMIGAYKDMYAPWKEMLNYYQQKEEARVKYQQVISQFEPAGLLSEEFISADQDLENPLLGKVSASGLTYTDDNDNPVFEALSIQLDLSKHTAIVGPSGNEKLSLTMILARVLDHSKGQLKFDDMDARSFTEAVTGRRISYSGSQPYIFSGTLGDNLFFSLKHRPVADPEDDGQHSKHEEWRRRESALSGNSLFDINAEWIDFQSISINGGEELTRELVRILRIVNLDEEVFQFGLQGTIDVKEHPEFVGKVLDARKDLRKRLADPKNEGYVEPFESEKYNRNASLIENLMFGTPVGGEFSGDASARHPFVRAVLKKAGLEEDLVEIGYKVASLMVELFSDMEGGNQNYQQFSFLDIDELPRFQALCSRLEGGESFGDLSEEERTQLIAPTFKMVTTRHRLSLIDEEIEAKILTARAIFARELPEELKEKIDFFDPDRFNATASIQDNILFGKLAHGKPHASTVIGKILHEVIEERGMFEAVIDAGLSTRVGTGGMILSNPARQKVGLARCILKKPDILVLYHLISRLDGSERQQILSALLEEFKDRGVIFALKYPTLAEPFDHILVMRAGELVEQGSFSDLDRPGTYFSELLEQERTHS